MKTSSRSVIAFAVVTLALFASAPLFAQTAPEKVLSAADVSAYIANFDAIQEGLDALGDKYDGYFPDAFEGADGNTDLASSFMKLRALNPPAEVAAVMKKNGLGDRGFVKFVVISYCIGIVSMQSALDLYTAQYADNAQMATYIDGVKKNVDAMKSAVHPADLKLVAARQAELAPLLDMDAAEY